MGSYGNFTFYKIVTGLMLKQDTFSVFAISYMIIFNMAFIVKQFLQCGWKSSWSSFGSSTNAFHRNPWINFW